MRPLLTIARLAGFATFMVGIPCGVLAIVLVFGG